MNIVWKSNRGSDRKTINTHIESIRKRLHELDEDNDYIETHRGIGDKIREFNELTNKRNALPLIHGKRLPSGSGSTLDSDDAKEEDINSLIGILGSLVDKHKELIDKHEE